MATVIGSRPESQVRIPQLTPHPVLDPTPVVAIADPPALGALQLVSQNPLSTSLSPVVMQSIAAQVEGMSIHTLPLKDISALCSETETKFSGVLDTILSKIDEIGGTKVPEIVKKLATSIQDENLDELAVRILNDKPGIGDKIRHLLSRASKKDSRERFMEETRDLLTGKTASMQKTMAALEGDLRNELTRLESSVNMIETVKEEYRINFIDYLISVIFTQAFLQQSIGEVNAYLPTLDMSNPLHQSEAKELTLKLESLQSRALALEGTLVNLPADDMVISQIHNATVTTRQELMIDIPSKFNRIKMTIIKLHGALILKGAQMVNEHSDRVDRALASVNSQLTRDVVTTASNLAGDNRKAQAEHILAIVKETGELMDIAEQGRKNNALKFDEARTIFDEARKLLQSK